MSDEESPSAAVTASRPTTDTLALATSAKTPLPTATGSDTGNFTTPALLSPASPATEAANSADDSIALRTATPTDSLPAASASAATTSPATETANSADDSVTLRIATPTNPSPAASASAATTSPATPAAEAKKATPRPPAPTLTPQRNTNASATDTIDLAADSISKTHALTNTQPASNATTPTAQSSALPTQTALQNSQLSETPQPEDPALLPATGQNVPPKTGTSLRTRYFAVGLILLMLAGGALASPEDRRSPH
ncbi:MAG TPA: hypothetical protein G4N96_03095 [Chloroflexi bacterium]|nr:hypothetical protein [Chloroflexota bacterium]